MAINKEVLCKIATGEFCTKKEYSVTIEFLLLALGNEFDVTFKYDLQENTNPQAIQAIAYTEEQLGVFQLSLLANLVLTGKSAHCDVMLYQNNYRISKSYRKGVYMQYSWIFDVDSCWVFKGHQDDEHGEYDSFSQIE
jgi:hypothetical protein